MHHRTSQLLLLLLLCVADTYHQHKLHRRRPHRKPQNNLHLIFDTAGEGNDVWGETGGGSSLHQLVLNVTLLVAPVQNLVPM